MVRTTGIEPVRIAPRDFKSLASTSSATSARDVSHGLFDFRQPCCTTNLLSWINPLRQPDHADNAGQALVCWNSEFHWSAVTATG